MPLEKRRILLTGATGQVGGQLLPMLEGLGEVIAPTRAEVDLADTERLRRFIRSVSPQWIINAAAYTAVDRAETDVVAAFAVNEQAPKVLGEEAVKLDAPVLHFSTDYVFGGNGITPWTEIDQTGPLSTYGASKLAGEQALASSGAAHLIFRSSWIYGATGSNFLLTILRLARDREEIKIVDDQVGAPTWSRDLARVVENTIQRIEREADGDKTLTNAIRPIVGTYHACNAGSTTWLGFAKEILRLAQVAEPGQAFARLVPISTSEYPTAANRPRNSRLNCDKLTRLLGYRMPTWQDSTSTVMAEIYSLP